MEGSNSGNSSDSDSIEGWTFVEEKCNAPVKAEIQGVTIDSTSPCKGGTASANSDRDSTEDGNDTDGIAVITDDEQEIISSQTSSVESQQHFNSFFASQISTTSSFCACDKYGNTFSPKDDETSSTATLPEQQQELLDDLFMANSKIRSYVHKRNNRISSLLNVVLLGTVVTTACLALGHMWGTADECAVNVFTPLSEVILDIQQLQRENYLLKSEIKRLQKMNAPSTVVSELNQGNLKMGVATEKDCGILNGSHENSPQFQANNINNNENLKKIVESVTQIHGTDYEIENDEFIKSRVYEKDLNFDMLTNNANPASWVFEEELKPENDESTQVYPDVEMENNKMEKKLHRKNMKLDCFNKIDPARIPKSGPKTYCQYVVYKAALKTKKREESNTWRAKSKEEKDALKIQRRQEKEALRKKQKEEKEVFKLQKDQEKEAFKNKKKEKREAEKAYAFKVQNKQKKDTFINIEKEKEDSKIDKRIDEANLEFPEDSEKLEEKSSGEQRAIRYRNSMKLQKNKLQKNVTTAKKNQKYESSERDFSENEDDVNGDWYYKMSLAREQSRSRGMYNGRRPDQARWYFKMMDDRERSRYQSAN